MCVRVDLCTFISYMYLSVCVCVCVCKSTHFYRIYVLMCVCVCVDLRAFISVHIPVATATDAGQFHHKGLLGDLWSKPSHRTVFLNG